MIWIEVKCQMVRNQANQIEKTKPAQNNPELRVTQKD